MPVSEPDGSHSNFSDCISLDRVSFNVYCRSLIYKFFVMCLGCMSICSLCMLYLCYESINIACYAVMRKQMLSTFSRRHFNLNLRLRRNLLSSDFRLVTVDKNNNEEEVKLNLDHFYEGFVEGECHT